MKIKLFKMDFKRNKILGLCLLVFSTNVFSEDSISQNTYLQGRLFSTIVMDQQGDCFSRSLEGRTCNANFKFISANTSLDPINYGGISLSSWISSPRSGPNISSFTPSSVSDRGGFTMFSLDNSGKMEDLSYRKGRYNKLEGQFSNGYYAIKSPNGSYWSAYLYHASNYKSALWGKVDDPEHPWQVCSATHSFSRERGCYDSAGDNMSHNLSVDADFTVHRDGQLGDDVTWVIEKDGLVILERWAKDELKYKYFNNTAGSSFKIWLKKFINGQYEIVSNIVQYNVSQSGGSNPTTGASIFDGAGSIIEPNTDCYGCDKDIAVMHPHSNANSTVVFQWLHDQGKCDNLVFTAEEPLSVEIKSKGWNTPIIQSAFKSQISATSSLRLYKQDDWTTIAVTSSEPIHNAIQITAKCALPVSGDRLPGPTRETIEKTPVIFSDGANWMGTGSLISTANRGTGDTAQYGILQDLAIGSNNSNAVTSFQWLSSDRCASLKLEDGNISGASRQAKVSIKLWDDATFSQLACNSLPCDIAAYADNTTYNYYVLKVESNTGSLPNDIRAVCQ